MDAKAALNEQKRPRAPKQRADKAKAPAAPGKADKAPKGKQAPAKNQPATEKDKAPAAKAAPEKKVDRAAIEKELREKFGIPKTEKPVAAWVPPEIETVEKLGHDQLRPFNNHPFNVDTKDPKFMALTVSIRTHGMAQVKGLFNEWHAAEASVKVRDVFSAKRAAGQYIAQVPFGYKRNPADKHKLVIDEEAAAVVRRIYDMAVAGNGYERIAKILTNEQVLTPRRTMAANPFPPTKGRMTGTIPPSAPFSITRRIWAIRYRAGIPPFHTR